MNGAAVDLTARFQRPDKADPGEPVARRCELTGCDNSLPLIPGRENQNKYCCQQHRSQAHQARRTAKHG
jgi:hypothetical protein